ncbi:MAG: hypothetical protein RL091_2150, partial [Verrucomicrobiota bacterium]
MNAALGHLFGGGFPAPIGGGGRGVGENGCTLAEHSMDGLGAGCGREAAAPAPAGLPCQNSNNSNKPRYKLRSVPNQPGVYTDGGKKRLWDERDADTFYRWGIPTGAEARSAFHLRLNVAAFIERWGRSHCLFFTVTDEANLHPTQF